MILLSFLNAGSSRHNKFLAALSYSLLQARIHQITSGKTGGLTLQKLKAQKIEWLQRILSQTSRNCPQTLRAILLSFIKKNIPIVIFFRRYAGIRPYILSRYYTTTSAPTDLQKRQKTKHHSQTSYDKPSNHCAQSG
jgi:hypothetical protein